MKSNPFYVLSASAMLLGCWLLSRALELEAGHLRGLLVLILVLQLYELLLVGLGTFLVRTKRAPRDGLVVLVLESAFLMNVTGLAAECVTAARGTGALVAAGIAALSVLKLWWVRRQAPDLLPKRTAVVLGAHAAVILAVPVALAELAEARLLSPALLYGLWWITAVLPLARAILRDATHTQAADAPQAHAIWTWMPCGLVLWNLWSVGYIHTLDFRPAFVAPLLLGLALVARPEQQRLKLALPLLSAFFSLAADPSLSFHVFGSSAAVTPLRVALVGVGLVWLYLGWRDRDFGLVALATAGATIFLLGPQAVRWARSLARLLVESAPRDRYGWGALIVIAAFVLLAAGARRSLQGDQR